MTIARELPPGLRPQYLLNKWNGRDEFVAGRMRELPHDPATGELTATRREVIAAFREIELMTRWPVDRAYLFRMTRGRIDVRALAIGRLQLQLDMRAALDDPEQLARLAEHLGIAEALDRFPRTRRLVIVPHDAIAGVPFAALPVGGAPLCARVAIAQIDRLERLQRRRWFYRLERGVAIGLDDYRGSGARDLAAAECEARDVAAALRGEALVGDRATCDAMSAAVRGAGWVHVAAHGAADAADPANSGIVLRDRAGHRTLALRELRQIEAERLSLVTLATCRSADAPVLPGGARICIPSALLDAGARGVIAALWPIEDGPSVEVMAALYARLRRKRPSVALAEMQAALRERPAHQWGVNIQVDVHA